jgi:hypothetical protein
LAQHSAQWIYGLTNKYALETAHCHGTQLHFVDPAYTSQACPNCGIIGHKGYFIRVDFSCSSVTPIKVEANWICFPQTAPEINSLVPDTTTKLTLTPGDNRRILAYAQEEALPSQPLLWGFYPQKGGTAFRCNNPLCSCYGQVLGRDVVGARNIASKNAVIWSLNRIKTHWAIISGSNGTTSSCIPIWPQPGNWSFEDRIQKIIRDISFLKAKYRTVYTLFDSHQYSAWFRTNSKTKKWKHQMETLQEFRLWSPTDWQTLSRLLQDPNLPSIPTLDWTQRITPPELLHIAAILGGVNLSSPRNFLLWKELQKLMDDSFLPTKN